VHTTQYATQSKLSTNMKSVHLQQQNIYLNVMQVTTMYRVLPFNFQYTASDLKEEVGVALE